MLNVNKTEHPCALIEEIYRTESRPILATLIRLLGDFDLAEDALHDAFTAALEQWSIDGIPHNPRSWLISTGRFKAIDTIRRRSRFDAALRELAEKLSKDDRDQFSQCEEDVKDDQLRLIFTCCHPALAPDAQIALTLREVCGLTTEEIARAFLSPTPTIAQRIVRAKAKIRDAKIPYQIPSQNDLPDRLETVLHVVYLVFNEGYSASSGDSLIRTDLSNEAIRLGHLLSELMPDTEIRGLLALMLLHESRRSTRTDSNGDIVLLEDQDRSRWNRSLINEGISLVEQSLSTGRIGPYTLQAAIASVHAEAITAEQTDWKQIASLYDMLLRIEPSPIVELNRAVAIAMCDGPSAGVAIIDEISKQGELSEYYLLHSARAELCRRLNRIDDAQQAYKRALELTLQEPERRFLERRLANITG